VVVVEEEEEDEKEEEEAGKVRVVENKASLYNSYWYWYSSSFY